MFLHLHILNYFCSISYCAFDEIINTMDTILSNNQAEVKFAKL